MERFGCVSSALSDYGHVVVIASHILHNIGVACVAKAVLMLVYVYIWIQLNSGNFCYMSLAIPITGSLPQRRLNMTIMPDDKKLRNKTLPVSLCL